MLTKMERFFCKWHAHELKLTKTFSNIEQFIQPMMYCGKFGPLPYCAGGGDRHKSACLLYQITATEVMFEKSVNVKLNTSISNGFYAENHIY